MKHVFYVDLRHLPYQTLINTLFYLMFHKNLFFFLKKISNSYKIAIFYTKIGLNLWNMTLNCKDLSFYTKNKNS